MKALYRIAYLGCLSLLLGACAGTPAICHVHSTKSSGEDRIRAEWRVIGEDAIRSCESAIIEFSPS